MNYKLEKTFERMHRLLEMRDALEQTYIPEADDSWGDDDGYYARLNDAYKKFYKAFDELVADEAARITKLTKE